MMHVQMHKRRPFTITSKESFYGNDWQASTLKTKSMQPSEQRPNPRPWLARPPDEVNGNWEACLCLGKMCRYGDNVKVGSDTRSGTLP